MKFSFEVGEHERHRVGFSFNQFWGQVEILVDGESVRRDLALFSLNLVRRYAFTVGAAERHDVVIEKERKLFLAGLRAQKYRVFVDGKLVEEHEGM